MTITTYGDLYITYNIFYEIPETTNVREYKKSLLRLVTKHFWVFLSFFSWKKKWLYYNFFLDETIISMYYPH